ncbi:MAG TPA: sugar kinase [Chloroflexota bacterium]|nr:sugar kinase [Chloroflexota bacterium]
MTRIVILGDIITDTIVRPHGPIAPDSDTIASIDTRPGGSGANLASWLALLQGDVHLIARVGNDGPGRMRVEELRAGDVALHVTADEAAPTGAIVILVESPTSRSMLTDPGANRTLDAADIPPALFQPGAWFHHSGYCLVYRPRALELARRLARQHGMPISVDPSSAAFIRQMGPDTFLQCTRGSDLLFPNLEEGQILTGLTDPVEVARALARSYREVALKTGAAGAVWAGGRETVRLPAEPAEVVDPTGAGDAFAAGFLHARLTGARPDEALRAGLHLAAQAVTRVGARPSDAAPKR